MAQTAPGPIGNIDVFFAERELIQIRRTGLLLDHIHGYDAVSQVSQVVIVRRLCLRPLQSTPSRRWSQNPASMSQAPPNPRAVPHRPRDIVPPPSGRRLDPPPPRSPGGWYSRRHQSEQRLPVRPLQFHLGGISRELRGAGRRRGGSVRAGRGRGRFRGSTGAQQAGGGEQGRENPLQFMAVPSVLILFFQIQYIRRGQRTQEETSPSSS